MMYPSRKISQLFSKDQSHFVVELLTSFATICMASSTAMSASMSWWKANQNWCSSSTNDEDMEESGWSHGMSRGIRRGKDHWKESLLESYQPNSLPSFQKQPREEELHHPQPVATLLWVSGCSHIWFVTNNHQQQSIRQHCFAVILFSSMDQIM